MTERIGMKGWLMDDHDILAKVSSLVDEEHKLRAGGMDGQGQVRLAQLETELDQCWDLLRQRQARREFGDSAEGAKVRPEAEVEQYLQ